MNHRSPRSARLHKIYRLLGFSLLDLLVLSLLFSLLVPVLLLLLFDPFTFLSALSASCRCCFRVGKVWLANFFTSGSLAFFFQAEDGIRAHCVTGVQTCALPI